MTRPKMRVGELSAITCDSQTKGMVRARVRVRLANGTIQQIAASASSKTRAADKVRKRAAEILGAPRGLECDENIVFEEMARLWIKRLRTDGRISSGTLAGYEQDLANVVNPHLGALRLWEVTPLRVQDVIDELAQTSARRARVFRSLTNRVFRYARVLGACDFDPVEATLLPRARSKKQVVTASLDDIIATREAIIADSSGSRPGPRGENMLLVLDLLAGTGARIGEVCSLRCKDFNEDAHTLTISSHLVKEGNGFAVEDGRKAGVADQVVYLPPLLVRELAEAVRGRDPHEFILATRTGTPPSPNNIRRSLRRIQANAGITPFTPHALRRTVGTAIARSMDSAASAAAQLGNTEEVARTHYIRPNNHGPQEAATILNPHLFRVSALERAE